MSAECAIKDMERGSMFLTLESLSHRWQECNILLKRDKSDELRFVKVFQYRSQAADCTQKFP